MILEKWEDIPSNMKNEITYKYYQKLEKRKFSLLLKRILDIIFSIVLLVISSPIFIVIAIWIKIDSKGPIFYRQERITKYGRMFKIFKFRTMVQNADKIGSLVTVNNDSRITKVGRVIRKFRIDEIPQLLNILLGDMSFVGTRPEVKKYVDSYTDEMKATLLMPAGVTSYASIKFKDEDDLLERYVQELKEKELTYAVINENIESSKENKKKYNSQIVDEAYITKILPQKMKYNLEYIDKFTIMKDLKICIDTVIGVLK